MGDMGDWTSLVIYLVWCVIGALLIIWTVERMMK